jgi:myo-inositol-1(or 4)-monophosphatase
MLFQDPAGFLCEVEEIARLGASQLMDLWRSLEPWQVSEKASNDLVSIADEASEEAILGAIGARFPEHRILSEETGWTGEGQGPTWIVDPLDGTTNFVRGLPHFAVSVAVAADDGVHFGVVIDPVKNDVFRAARSHGATWNGQPCRVSDRAGIAGSFLTTGFPFRSRRLVDTYLAIFRDVFVRCKAIRRPGAAALDLAYIACGIFDGFFEFQLSPWDIAAGAVLVEEAGGIITDMDGGGDFLSTGDVVCGAPGVHRDILEQVRKHRADWLGR